ncbi:MAG: PAS domain-containing protein [candidate division Zixibacteria bacterium]|nr:PAS domain-containing protein [candidate division Zixibacteria bacterium]
MRRHRLFWKIYPYYLIIIVISLALTAWYGSREMRAMYTDEISDTLEARARIAGRLLKPILMKGDTVLLDRECKEIASLSNTRVTIVNAEGIVFGDSNEDPSFMENHGTRPEIVQAYGREIGVTTRYSNTLQTTMMYVAIPVIENDEVIAVVRTAIPVSGVKDTLTSFHRNIIIGGIVIVALAAMISVVVLRRLTDPLRELRDGAGRFADGDLHSMLQIPDTEEIADLAESMNSMAGQLDARISTIAEQRNEREAILSSMSEGVLALDANEKVVSLNRVASDFLGLDPEQSRGRAIYEVIRIPSLLEFIERALHSPDTTEIQISLPGTVERYLQARAATLKDSSSERVGVVLVLNDITRLKKLENIRRDFVANVSHELKTPITAIAGSIETLLDGALDSPDDNRRFIEMIARHSERLNSIVEDLLSLARLESETVKEEVVLTHGQLAEVLQASVLACRERIAQRHVEITCSCDHDLEANMNKFQLEQAITNLIVNAIKFSDPGSSVTVEAISTDNEIVISVRDNGVGIAAEHLPRLFERFYRVDKARSRKEGGTGLGLAIVKHVAVAHGGHVSVDSAPGKGSTFRVHLPVSS